jgi:hypothetical protein
MSTTTFDANVISVDYAIEQVEFGMFQYMVLLACALCNASDGMSVMLLSFLAPVLIVNWDLPTDEAARLTSKIFAGALLVLVERLVHTSERVPVSSFSSLT